MIYANAFWLRFMGAVYSVYLAAGLLVGTAYADDLKDVLQLVQDQRYPAALDKVDAYLATHQQDARGQFIKGVILARQDKRPEAIGIFSELTRKHPELPEPYNNLAVLYADQGQYEKARQALEMAMKTHPSYSVAYENLGGVYAKMASDAYDKALQVERGTSHPLPRLAMLDDVVPNPSASLVKAVPATRLASTAAIPAASTARPVLPIPSPAEVKPVQVKPAPPAAVAAIAKPVEAKPAVHLAATENTSKKVLAAVDRWAAAWSAKDVKAYLACYADNFKTPDGESRADWAKTRRARISKPVSIKVLVLNPKVIIKDDQATVSFKQSYRAGEVAKRTNKTLSLRQISGRWLIEREDAGK